MAEHNTNDIPVTWELPFGETAELEFSADAVSVTLQPAEPGERPRMQADADVAEHLDASVDRRGNTVRVEVEWNGRFPNIFNRGARVILYVPREITGKVSTDAGAVIAHDLGPCDLRLAADAGAIEVEDVHGTLKLEADAGPITLRRCEGDIRAEASAGPIRAEQVRGQLRFSTDAGPINGRGIAGTVRAEADAGPIKMEILALDEGESRLTADLGPVNVSLAPDLDVRIETRGGMGPVRVRYPSRDGAAAVLRVGAGMGPIRVDTIGGDGEPADFSGPAGGWAASLGDLGERIARQVTEQFMGPAGRRGERDQTREERHRQRDQAREERHRQHEQQREERHRQRDEQRAQRHGQSGPQAPVPPVAPAPSFHPATPTAPSPMEAGASEAEPARNGVADNATEGAMTEPAPPPPRDAGALDGEMERILKMVEAGDLSPADADDLLRALNHE